MLSKKKKARAQNTSVLGTVTLNHASYWKYMKKNFIQQLRTDKY